MQISHNKRKWSWLRLPKFLRRRRHIGNFETMMLPMIKTFCVPDLGYRDIVSVQPMTDPDPSLIISWEFFDENNPKIGQVFRVEKKYPITHPEWYDWCCCVKGDYWRKIYT